jgi:hypothetical protein
MSFLPSLINRVITSPIHVEETGLENNHLLLRLNADGNDGAIPLETIYLYYRASADVTVTISPNGLPVAAP